MSTTTTASANASIEGSPCDGELAMPRLACDDEPARPLLLLGEDDDELRELLAGGLHRRGWAVLEARNGAQLAELVFDRAVEPPEDAVGRAALVITDHRMPGRTGLEIIGLLRGSNPLIPIIVISGFVDAETRREAARLGVARVFAKPLDLNALSLAAFQSIGMAG